MSDQEPRELTEPEPVKGLPVQFCPVCSSNLESRHCKAVCPRCGYFMSCSEFEQPLTACGAGLAEGFTFF